MDKLAQDSTVVESYKTVLDSDFAAHFAFRTQPTSTSPSATATTATTTTTTTRTPGPSDDCFAWIWELDHSNLNKEPIGFDSGNISSSSSSSVENMDTLDITLGSLSLTDHAFQPKMDPTSFTALLPLHIPSKADGLPLTSEEEEWYEFIALTTRLEEWSQKRLEECWLPHECELSPHVLGSREGRVMWGLVIVWYMNEGWLEHYRTIWPRDVIEAAGLQLESIFQDMMKTPVNWTATDLDTVEVKVYRLSRAGREELMGVLRSRLMSEEGHEEDVLMMDGADSEEVRRIMSGMRALEQGPPADAQL